MSRSPQLTNTLLEIPIWQHRVNAHQEKVSYWVDDRRRRAGIGEKHPVYDFLFDYYSFRPSQLARWSPGMGVLLAGADSNSFAGASDFHKSSEGLSLDGRDFPEHRIKFLEWAIRYLRETRSRPAQLGCFGLHEWAMLYQCQTARHQSVPWRVSQEAINSLCETLSIRCTHYDAYRFFTPQALPLNNRTLARSTTNEHDQPGCIHVTMDLYRYAYKIAPYSSAELIADTFALALKAREIDMRASPYDLSNFGFTPITIETISGRSEYVDAQRGLIEEAKPLRERLICEYQTLLDYKIDSQSHAE